ncbi:MULTISPECIES: metalloregulator ArsR/SmtB family transcription factor [unclassified Devosia]|jgi:DNA-binding transcriptional ArsR family regulator|uniref:ArsR/SmtB family transcription factor n=1 Tax=unclassified Devosia TaxID=196773 RepID=UPI00086E21C3|nr:MULTISPECIES: metalloregulator ArsR/SmtB family transcription factor [unclassified Devosia]MBN9364114.1 helix-turn-helix transcriptional regulator [Devosia sp.]ODS82056.1 MAG: transcriptional regulator [Devosia sp. SCN 66-27]OJX27359.1 MAG: transcriptional regulator [Devosia sp. 66-14]
MSSDDENDKIFKALGNRVRRNMLDRLKDNPQTTGALCDAFPELDRCTVMQHLKVLEDAELVIPRREGRERWNHLNAIPIQQLHERWIGSYAAYAAQGLLKLKQGLEG